MHRRKGDLVSPSRHIQPRARIVFPNDRAAALNSLSFPLLALPCVLQITASHWQRCSAFGGLSARLHEKGGVKYFVPGLGALACPDFSVAACSLSSFRSGTYGWGTSNMGKRRFVFAKHNALFFLLFFFSRSWGLRFTFPGVASASITPATDGCAQRRLRTADWRWKLR